MASNPMQRKARNSFLLGMLVMLVILGIVIAFLVMTLMDKIKKEKEELAAKVNVYVLSTDVNSGQTITSDMYKKQSVNKNEVPSNAIGDIEILNSYALQDKEGNEITSETDKDNGNKIKLKITINNVEYEVLREDDTDNYYYINKQNEKNYIQLNQVPVVAKVSMKAHTIITEEFLSKGDSKITNDVRKQEYNMLVLPMDIQTGNYVDVRLMLPSGQDYIVLSKKEVEIPVIAGVDSTDTVWFNMSEDETLIMNSAIIEAYQLDGAKLYLAQYTEPGMQDAATPTYVPNYDVTQILQVNPNIVDTAKSELKTRYSSENEALRNNQINAAINSAGNTAQSNAVSGMQQSITKTQTTRKSYLDGLGQ